MPARLRRHGPHSSTIALAVLIAIAIAGCTGAEAPDLATAASEAQFASVADLGPHTMSAVIERSEAFSGASPLRRQEGVEIRWESWDAFETRRLVNGSQVSCVRVADGSAWSQRRDGTWVQRGDPEPARQELRLVWNSWEQALESFDDRVALTPSSSEIVEGRRAQRFLVSLTEPEPEPQERTSRQRGKGKGKGKGKRRRSRGDANPRSLRSLTGEVVIDEGTAVRLLAKVRGEWQDGLRTHTVALDLSRAGFGLPQALTAPTESEIPALPPPGDP